MNRMMLGSVKAAWREQELLWDPDINLLDLIVVNRVMILRVHITCNKIIIGISKTMYF